VPENVAIETDQGREVLLVNGVLQSVSPAASQEWGSYWAAMVPPFRPSRALILGLGGGTLAHLIHQRWGEVPIVGVDASADVIATAREAGWLDLPHLEVVIQDARAYLGEDPGIFDYVAVDLYVGGTFQTIALKPGFQRDLQRVLPEGSWLAINLYGAPPESAGRLSARFAPIQTLTVGENLVLHARSRR
jgi:spermidine synthase